MNHLIPLSVSTPFLPCKNSLQLPFSLSPKGCWRKRTGYPHTRIHLLTSGRFNVEQPSLASVFVTGERTGQGVGILDFLSPVPSGSLYQTGLSSQTSRVSSLSSPLEWTSPSTSSGLYGKSVVSSKSGWDKSGRRCDGLLSSEVPFRVEMGCYRK